LDTVAKYYSHPWNEEVRETLRMLQHVTLATNSIASYDYELAEWAEDKVADALKAYKNGDNALANSIASEILKKGLEIENPLGIRIDGNSSEWRSLDPIYFNPSTILPWSNILWFVEMREDLKNLGNLKAVYAVNDSENLYLMLDFYGPASKCFVPPCMGIRIVPPYIGIDTSGEWSHQEGKEFHITTAPPALWTSEYKGLEWSCRRPQTPTSPKLADLGIGYGEVIEVKIPLESLGNPKKVNLIVYYPWIAPWGGMEVEIVDWGK
jgi:hypothetical protein